MALTLLRLAPVPASARGLAAVAQRSVRRRRAGGLACPPGATPSPVPGPLGGGSRWNCLGTRSCPLTPQISSRGQNSGPSTFLGLHIEANRPPAAHGWEAGLQAPYPGQVCGARTSRCGERLRAWHALPDAPCPVAALTASPGGGLA